MAAHAYFYRSVPGASFIVEDASVWLRLEGRAGGYALLDLGPMTESGAIDLDALGRWGVRIAELAAHLSPQAAAASPDSSRPDPVDASSADREPGP